MSADTVLQGQYEITWKDRDRQPRTIALGQGQSVLDGLQAAGIEVANSCRSGVCQACLLRASAGTPPPASQKGLRETLRAQGYFLSCQAHPDGDLTVDAGEALEPITAVIRQCSEAAPNIVRLILEPQAPFSYRPGQFIHLGVAIDAQNAKPIVRAYSLASLPSDGPALELHIKHIPGGLMSQFVFGGACEGTEVTVRGPLGSCFYVEGNPEQGLVLAGTGTGAAPLIGIVRAALQAGHTGPITLFHGALDPSGLYAHERLSALDACTPNFSYRPVVLQNANGRGLAGTPVGSGDVKDLVIEAVRRDASQRVFLCGPPPLVNPLKKAVFLAGISLSQIHADPFVTSAPA